MRFDDYNRYYYNDYEYDYYQSRKCKCEHCKPKKEEGPACNWRVVLVVVATLACLIITFLYILWGVK